MCQYSARLSQHHVRFYQERIMRVFYLLLLGACLASATPALAQLDSVDVEPLPAPVVPQFDRSRQVANLDRMPMFRSPDCDTAALAARELEVCSQRQMLRYIYSGIEYPTLAQRDSVQGTAVVRFIIERDGTITNAQVLRDPGAGIGVEALRIVASFEPWLPGLQAGEPVRVQFNLPIRFKLD